MKIGPNISSIAFLMGNPGRANMLSALMDGRSLTASELATLAGITKQTASAHIGKLLAGQLIKRDIQGRHHYYRLSGVDVAQAIEVLMGVAAVRYGKRIRTGPKEPELRHARRCYDHLAGEMGVLMFDSMAKKGWLAQGEDVLTLTSVGKKNFVNFGIEIDVLIAKKRPLCAPCLDWSQRRYHLRGSLAQAILNNMVGLGWLSQVENTRIIRFSTIGKTQFMNWLE